jgi:hypothetical protein
MAQKLKITIQKNGQTIEFYKQKSIHAIIEFINYIEKENGEIEKEFLKAIESDYIELFKKGGNKRVYLGDTEKFKIDKQKEEKEIKEELEAKLINFSLEIANKRNVPPSTYYRPVLSEKRTYFFNGNYSTEAHCRNLKRVLKSVKGIKVELITIENKKYVTTQENNETEEITEDTIFFGPPGTGKSHRFKDIEKNNNVFRVTFHPEYTYSDFVGQYKPVVGYHTDSNSKLDRETFEVNGKLIKGKKPIVLYDFVPGIFTKATLKAFDDPDTKTFLIIEEINRGNCAAIFGDIFQLLDRQSDKQDGNRQSEYSIDLPEEILQYIKENNCNDNFQEIIETGKLRLPSNLYICATMNTSDQSLFPMDSAFKRRWEMEYIPIKYNHKDDLLDGSYFIFDNKKHDWINFLYNINKKITEITQAEDRQMGPWFVSFKNDVNDKQFFTEKTFKNKVLSYLFFDVFKFKRSEVFEQDSFSKLMECKSLKEIFKKGILENDGK